MITEETVQHVAKLARLQVEADEMTQYAQDLGKILALVEEMAALDLSGISVDTGTVQPTHFRSDEVVKVFERDALMANAPQAEEGFFWVPKILEEDTGS